MTVGIEDILKSYENLNLDPKFEWGVIIGLAIVFFTIIFIRLIRGSSTKKNLVLILGVSNSGKTTLFSQLVYKKTLFTQTSITQNSGTAIFEKTKSSKEKKVDLVDIPGNDKVRRKFLDTYKKNAKALIFVVDSSTLQKDLKDVALYIYDTLVDDQLAKSNLRLLILCNKQDIEFAKGASSVKTSLEKEIELLRRISTSALKSTNEGHNNKSVVLRSGSDATFQFDDLKYFKVVFEETSCLDQDSIDNTIVSWF